jgi:hypothetical protein
VSLILKILERKRSWRLLGRRYSTRPDGANPGAQRTNER